MGSNSDEKGEMNDSYMFLKLFEFILNYCNLDLHIRWFFLLSYNKKGDLMAMSGCVRIRIGIWEEVV